MPSSARQRAAAPMLCKVGSKSSMRVSARRNDLKPHLGVGQGRRRRPCGHGWPAFPAARTTAAAAGGGGSGPSARQAISETPSRRRGARAVDEVAVDRRRVGEGVEQGGQDRPRRTRRNRPASLFDAGSRSTTAALRPCAAAARARAAGHGRHAAAGAAGHRDHAPGTGAFRQPVEDRRARLAHGGRRDRLDEIVGRRRARAACVRRRRRCSAEPTKTSAVPGAHTEATSAAAARGSGVSSRSTRTSGEDGSVASACSAAAKRPRRTRKSRPSSPRSSARSVRASAANARPRAPSDIAAIAGFGAGRGAARQPPAAPWAVAEIGGRSRTASFAQRRYGVRYRAADGGEARRVGAEKGAHGVRRHRRAGVLRLLQGAVADEDRRGFGIRRGTGPREVLVPLGQPRRAAGGEAGRQHRRGQRRAQDRTESRHKAGRRAGRWEGRRLGMRRSRGGGWGTSLVMIAFRAPGRQRSAAVVDARPRPGQVSRAVTTTISSSSSPAHRGMAEQARRRRACP